MWLAVPSQVCESWVMDCLDVFLISSEGGFKKQAVAAGHKSSWVASSLHTSKQRAVPHL